MSVFAVASSKLKTEGEGVAIFTRIRCQGSVLHARDVGAGANRFSLRLVPVTLRGPGNDRGVSDYNSRTTFRYYMYK